MSVGRVLSCAGAVIAVAGCTVVAIGMSRAAENANSSASSTSPAASAASTAAGESPRAGLPPVLAPTSPTSSGSRGSSAAGSAPRGAADPSAPGPVSTTAARPPRAASAPAAPPPQIPGPVRGVSLPVGGTTGSATRVITVVASSYASTTATLQAWDRAPGGGWLRYGPAIGAHVGSDGLTASPSESKSATPIGSFTLTQAFGHDANPGTSLPYLQTSPADWWVSQYGGNYSGCYNTLQTGPPTGACPYTQASPNEHLYYETPFYNYAVVIDANTRNAPGGVVQGAGSAFFLHVTDGNPTAGCVAIPQSNLVTIMQWLAPATHPRILIGVS